MVYGAAFALLAVSAVAALGVGGKEGTMSDSTLCVNVAKTVLGTGVFCIPGAVAAGTGLVPAVALCVAFGAGGGYTSQLPRYVLRKVYRHQCHHMQRPP